MTESPHEVVIWHLGKARGGRRTKAHDRSLGQCNACGKQFGPDKHSKVLRAVRLHERSGDT